MSVAPKRRCIFCDEPAKLTKEHLWSRWTRRLIRHDSLKHEYENRVFNTDGIDRAAKTLDGDARNRGIRAVCKNRSRRSWSDSFIVTYLAANSGPWLMASSSGKPH